MGEFGMAVQSAPHKEGHTTLSGAANYTVHSMKRAKKHRRHLLCHLRYNCSMPPFPHLTLPMPLQNYTDNSQLNNFMEFYSNSNYFREIGII